MARKIKSKTDNSGWADPSKKKKVRKRRKPMTEEQKQAAAERLEKARAGTALQKILTMVNLVFMRVYETWQMMHPSIQRNETMDQDAKNLRLWSAEMRSFKGKGATDRRMSHEAYVRNMQRYLRDGDWIDLFYGEHQEKDRIHM